MYWVIRSMIKGNKFRGMKGKNESNQITQHIETNNIIIHCPFVMPNLTYFYTIHSLDSTYFWNASLHGDIAQFGYSFSYFPFHFFNGCQYRFAYKRNHWISLKEINFLPWLCFNWIIFYLNKTFIYVW